MPKKLLKPRLPKRRPSATEREKSIELRVSIQSSRAFQTLKRKSSLKMPVLSALCLKKKRMEAYLL